MPRLTLRANAALTNWFQGFTQPRSSNTGGTIVLGHRRVYIVPSRLGLLFGGVLLILLMGSINYALSLGFALTFLLAGAGLAGMVQTARNLARLAVQAGRAEPAFAGGHALYRLVLANAAAFDRPEILLRHVASGAQCRLDVAAAGSAEAVLAVPAARRGWQPLGRVMLETRFPLGLFRAWSFVEPECRCLVYPRPEPGALPPHAPSLQAGGARAHAQGSDDFSGLRAYQPSDSPRRSLDPHAQRETDSEAVRWRGGGELWLTLGPAHLIGLESRLSRLAGWVLAAERSAAHNLRLPGGSPGRGERIARLPQRSPWPRQRERGRPPCRAVIAWREFTCSQPTCLVPGRTYCARTWRWCPLFLYAWRALGCAGLMPPAGCSVIVAPAPGSGSNTAPSSAARRGSCCWCCSPA
jgi:hypothetical protein